MLKITLISLFPEMFDSPLRHSILRRAQEKKLTSIELVDLRAFASGRHRVTDDYPYGGGHGMVMKLEPLVSAIETMRRNFPMGRVILLSPQGKVFSQQDAARLAEEQHLILICGRYEGVDERVKSFIDEELSVGDYTLSGGEPAAHVVIDAVTRLIPGVLGNENSVLDESFANGLLEYPQFTRPQTFRGLKVPEVLLSGDHKRIAEWRRAMSFKYTLARRPDLISGAHLTDSEKSEALAVNAPVYVALLHYPVYDKNGDVVTTAVTNMDIHDISRSGRTYGIRGFYVVTPVKTLQKLAAKIIAHWEEGYGSQYNATRKEALALARIRDTLDDALIDIENESGGKPVLVVTSARPGPNRASFAALRDMLRVRTQPVLLLFGTGWGLAEAVISRSDYVLEAVGGPTAYNHLSVRSAAAIVLDRLLGRTKI